MNYIKVLYHSNCYDGFGSAFAAWKCFKECVETRVNYYPVSYGFPPPELIDKEKDIDNCTKIYILDFSYDEETLVKLYEKYNCHIVVIDHHKTAKEALEPLVGKYEWLNVKFDMEKSGAVLSWEYFINPTKIPKLIQHIGDRDLWKFEMEGTKQIHKALLSYPMDFELWNTFEKNIEGLKSEGVALERMYANLVDNICKHPFIKEIAGHKVPCVNTSIAWSEVGQKLLSMYPDAKFVASFTVFEKQVMWSLRSRKDFDVSAIAKKFGGGGHAQAAGFKTVKV